MTRPTVRHANYIDGRYTVGAKVKRRESGFNPWSYIGGIVTVLVLEFVFIAVVL